ncbi:PP2C family protein-serine/threonine phosphatase [Marinomonas sp. ef1]|uniref:PP2C family protein-serine/threonine phosphatase n=1 Tax=Marinomonas sp. ef1 TaxID=2005043 RepID=UPI000C28BF23|nr:protein phosphatase 2C domain-containing protein [Marinomonas sp. ef1]
MIRIKRKIIESCSFSYPKSEGLDNHDAVLPAVTVNEDIYFALADGVGRSSEAQLTAIAAIESVFDTIKSSSSPNMDDIFKSVQLSLERIASQELSSKKMATTLVVCKINKKGVTIGNVGDSRAYVINGRALKKITNDHTEKETLLERGVFTKKELKNHRSENVLTNSLRPFKEFKIELHHEEIKSGSIILVSDGVYKAFEGKRVIGNVSSIDLAQVCLNMKKQVQKVGSKDDFSLVAVSFE